MVFERDLCSETAKGPFSDEEGFVVCGEDEAEEAKRTASRGKEAEAEAEGGEKRRPAHALSISPHTSRAELSWDAKAESHAPDFAGRSKIIQ